MKLGIIGCGFIAEEFMENIKNLEGIEVVACYSRTISNTKTFCEKFDIKNVCNSVEELFNSDIDSVYIASHSNSHYEYSLKAIESGLNILCEKPVTINSIQLEEVIKKANEKNVVYMEAMRLMYIPAYLKLKELIRNEHFGKILSIETSNGRISSRLYRHTLELAGGALLDLGVYCIYAIVDLLGKPKDIKASALKLDTEVDSTTIGVFEYEKSLATMYCSCVSQTRGDLRVLCEKGTITLNDMAFGDNLVLNNKNNEVETLTFERTSTGMIHEVEEFMKDVKANKSNSYVLEDKSEISLNVMKAMDEIRKQIGLVYPVDKANN